MKLKKKKHSILLECVNNIHKYFHMSIFQLEKNIRYGEKKIKNITSFKQAVKIIK